MKLKIRILSTLALALVISLPDAFPQEKPADSTPAENREVDHQELIQLRKQFIRAISEMDMDLLADCFTEKFSFTGTDQSRVTTRQELKDYYHQLIESEDAPLEKVETIGEAETRTIFINGGAGYVYGKGTDTYTLKNGMEVTVDNKWTAMVVNIDGKWKIAALHIGVNFYDNASFDRLRSEMRNIMIGVGIVALLLGGIIGLKFRKQTG